MEESRPETEAQAGGQGKSGRCRRHCPEKYGSVAPNPRAPGPSPLDTYPAAARTACQLATGRAQHPRARAPAAIPSSPRPVAPWTCARGPPVSSGLALPENRASPAQPSRRNRISFVASFWPTFVNKLAVFFSVSPSRAATVAHVRSWIWERRTRLLRSRKLEIAVQA